MRAIKKCTTAVLCRKPLFGSRFLFSIVKKDSVILCFLCYKCMQDVLRSLYEVAVAYIQTNRHCLTFKKKKKPVGVPSEFASDAKLECQA